MSYISSQPLTKSSGSSTTLEIAMRIRRFLGIAFLLHCLASAEVIRFDNCPLGKLPLGWTIAMTHDGAAPRWEIVRDESARRPRYVLAQLSQDGTAGRFPLAILDRITVRDGDVSVAFRAVNGTVDQAAGIVWRYQDPNNYYIIRANALENNVVLYKVENGVRLSIAPKGLPSRSYGVKHEIPRRRWNTLKIAFKDGSFTVFLNDERLFETEDRTFTKAGKTGLWTKADSITYFSDFTVVNYNHRRQAMKLTQGADNMNRRNAITTLMACLTIPIVNGQSPQQPADKTQTIVFVCQYGSAKSVIAARFFNRMAAERGLPYRAVARGIEPESTIPPYVREPIRGDGFEIGVDEKPVALDIAETRNASSVVAIMCKLPPAHSSAARESSEWTDVPDVSEGYAAARDKIVAHLNEIVNKLAATSK